MSPFDVQFYNNKSTITDAGSTATNSKAKTGLDWILLTKLVLLENLAVLTIRKTNEYLVRLSDDDIFYQRFRSNPTVYAVPVYFPLSAHRNNSMNIWNIQRQISYF